MKAKALLLLMVVALMGAVAMAPTRAVNAAPPAASGVNVDLTSLLPAGTLVNGQAITSSVLNVTNFTSNNGVLSAVGNVTTTLANGQTINQAVSLPVNLLASTGSCQILDLVLGPISLDLLGLQVTTDTIHLNITAQSGPGNLVGNLLCGVAHLLDTNGPLSGLAGLLNNLLRHL